MLGGGGFAGLAYLGVLRYLQAEGYLQGIRGIAGTSMGAFFAVAFAIGVPCSVLEDELPRHMLSEGFRKIPLRGRWSQLWTTAGLDTGDRMLEPLRGWIARRWPEGPPRTFLDFAKQAGVDLVICATRLDTGQPVLFSVDKTPHVDVLEAVRASMALPVVIRPVAIDGVYYVDGAVCGQTIPRAAFARVAPGAVLVCYVHNRGLPPAAATPQRPPNLLRLMFQVMQAMFAILFPVPEDFPYTIGLADPPMPLLPFQIVRNEAWLDVSDEKITASIVYGYQQAHHFFRALPVAAPAPEPTG